MNLDVLGPFQVLECPLTLLPADAKPPTEPVVWWKFDEAPGSVVVDVAGNQLDGEIRGPVRWTASRESQTGALEFEGERNWVESPDSGSLSFQNGLTVSVWFKVRHFEDAQATLIAKGDAWQIRRQTDRGGLKFQTSGLKSKANSTSLTTKGPVDDGQWHHVIAVYDGGRVTLYLDGVEQSSVKASGVLACNNLPVTLGDNAMHRGRFFDGWLDDVRVYARGLNADEVVELCKAGAP